MAEQTIIVNISGYWREPGRFNVMASPGVYFVYDTCYHRSENTVDLLKLIFIGAAANIREALLEPENLNAWRSRLEPGHELCFSSAAVDHRYMERVMAAYIYAHKPKGNKEFCFQFPFDRTTVISTGKTALIQPVISLRTTLIEHIEPHAVSFRHEMIPVRAVQLGGYHNRDVG